VHQQCPGTNCSICQWLDLRKKIVPNIRVISWFTNFAYTMCAKNETRVILNRSYSCKSTAMKCSVWYADDLSYWMNACIICRLTLVMFLHYLTLHKNWNATLTSWSINTWDRIPPGIIDKAVDQWQTRLRACVKAKGRHFEHLLWSSLATGSFQSHLHAKLVLFRTTHTNERKTT